MDSTGRKKNQQKIQLSHLNETLSDIVIGENTNVGAKETIF